MNVNSLINKLHYLNNFISQYSLSVISVTETWLTESCNSSFVQIPNFIFYRGDVVGAVRKHGAGLYVDCRMKQVQVEVDLPNLVVVHLLELGLYVVSVYRPPSSSEEDNLRLMQFLLEFSVGKALIVLGDFNLPTLKWSQSGPGFQKVTR